MKHARIRGFTLIEVMVTIAVLAIGILGIAMYTAVGLRTGAENTVRATALQVASQVMEPLNAAARGGPATFQAALASAFPAGSTPPYARTVTANNGESFIVQLALNASGAAFIYDDATPAVNWLAATGSSGVTVSLLTQVGYTKIDGTRQNTTTTYTFVVN